MKNAFDFDRSVTEYFLATGKECTAKELAEFSNVSVSVVRKVVSDSKYKSSDVTVDRPVIERNYMTIRCYRKVNAYAPSRSMLRAEILKLQSLLDPRQ